MNNQDNLKKIADVFHTLPPDLQKALLSADISIKVRDISNKYNLHIDKIPQLELEVMFVLLGIEPVSRFIDQINKKLDITREEAEGITRDVQDTIFKSVTNSLRQIEGEILEDERTANGSNQDNIESHAEILHAIEHPEHYQIPQIITPKTNIQVQGSPVTKPITPYIPQSKESANNNPIPQKTQPPTKPSSDPYREPI